MISRLFSTINKYPIIVTNNAWIKMSDIIQNQDSYGFLFSATSGGCNGFNYKLDLLDVKKYNKFLAINTRIKPTILVRNNAKICIDPMSEILLLGTTIDYIKEDFSKNIFESKFIYITDKTISSSCGCGISFTPNH